MQAQATEYVDGPTRECLAFIPLRLSVALGYLLSAYCSKFRLWFTLCDALRFSFALAD